MLHLFPRSFISLSLIFPVSNSAAEFVYNALVEGRPEDARIYAYIAMLHVLFLICSIELIFYFIWESTVSIFSSNPDIVARLIDMNIFAAVFGFCRCMQIFLQSMLRVTGFQIQVLG